MLSFRRVRFAAIVLAALAVTALAAPLRSAAERGAAREPSPPSVGAAAIGTAPFGSRFAVLPAADAPRAASHSEGEPLTTLAAAPREAIFYLNRGGGSYSAGYNDSRTNRSSVLAGTSAVPPWSASDDEWAEVVGCVGELFSDYRVEITDVDPGQTPHTEAVIGGRAADLALNVSSELAGGLSPFRSDCGVIENSIVFVFAEEFEGELDTICQVVAQEIAHSFGLDHEYLCEDPMSYLSDCGPKAFRDEMAPCGEYEPRSCADTASPPAYDCGRDQQNSVALLSARLGRRDGRGELVELVGGCQLAGGSLPRGAGLAALLLLALGGRRRRSSRHERV